jgi:hypothetical protein
MLRLIHFTLDYIPPSVLSSPAPHPEEPFDPYRELQGSRVILSNNVNRDDGQSQTGSLENNPGLLPTFSQSGHGTGNTASGVNTMPPSYDKLKTSGREDEY